MHPNASSIRECSTNTKHQGHHALHCVHFGRCQLRNSVNILAILAHLRVQHPTGCHEPPEALGDVILKVGTVVVEEPFACIGRTGSSSSCRHMHDGWHASREEGTRVANQRNAGTRPSRTECAAKISAVASMQHAYSQRLRKLHTVLREPSPAIFGDRA